MPCAASSVRRRSWQMLFKTPQSAPAAGPCDCSVRGPTSRHLFGLESKKLTLDQRSSEQKRHTNALSRYLFALLILLPNRVSSKLWSVALTKGPAYSKISVIQWKINFGPFRKSWVSPNPYQICVACAVVHWSTQAFGPVRRVSQSCAALPAAQTAIGQSMSMKPQTIL